MPQQKCIDQENSYYHVYNRGVNRQDIFIDILDRYFFIKLCRKSINKFKIEFHAFCLMNNHYHLLIHTQEPNLSKVMKYLGESYAKYYTRKYSKLNKSGHTFMGRYGRKIILDNSYMSTLFQYIHLNPVKDKFCDHPSEYRWSSYNSYLKNQDQFNFLNLERLKYHFHKFQNQDKVEIQNEILNLSYTNKKYRKIIHSSIMKRHLREYDLDIETQRKLYTYCLLEWTELSSSDLEEEFGLSASAIRNIKHKIKFELEDNNILLENLIYSVKKSLELF